ncbi:hypothetical protein T492DRAFT_1050870 [Pavlovales sp. CCMP2436]|nr:hypothetical protein T492DRAFT_1050870 [Pavlovales sp. CCMP2436]
MQGTRLARWPPASGAPVAHARNLPREGRTPTAPPSLALVKLRRTRATSAVPRPTARRGVTTRPASGGLSPGQTGTPIWCNADSPSSPTRSGRSNSAGCEVGEVECANSGHLGQPRDARPQRSPGALLRRAAARVSMGAGRGHISK